MSEPGKFDDLPEARRRGLEKMEQVYGFDMQDAEGDFFRYTADHLFGDIWQRPGLSDRDRRLLLIGNYTYTQSRVTSDGSIVIGPNLQPVAANLLFRDGAPLTGQSDHLANLQVGIEDTDSLSQATFALTYASERVTNRGPIQGELRQPDFLERPGVRLDFVLRQEVPFFGARAELKFEARNLLGQDYEEFQAVDGNRIEINSYNLGQSFSLGLTFRF